MSDVHIDESIFIWIFLTVSIFFYAFHFGQLLLINFFEKQIRTYLRIPTTGTFNQITGPILSSVIFFYLMEMILFSTISSTNVFFFFLEFYSPFHFGYIFFILGMSFLSLSRFSIDSKKTYEQKLTRRQYLKRVFVLSSITYGLLIIQKTTHLFPKHFWAVYIIVQTLVLYLIFNWNNRSTYGH
ncbi:hypothetical protein KFE94_05435 [bacterium SCSIO 12643]|nr:hypothetical protein KFE94_05435 [bacterium SCSIO 12643]